MVTIGPTPKDSITETKTLDIVFKEDGNTTTHIGLGHNPLDQN